MLIAGYLQTSLIDWTDKISSVIWTVGCNFKCPFCHNGSLVLPEVMPKKAEMFSESDIILDLEKRKKWIDGLVITGGEPTLQNDLSKFCQKVKQKGVNIKLDTNGSNPDALKELINHNLIDYVAMDLKTNFENYSVISNSNVDINKIIESMSLLLSSNIDFEFRTTIVPKLHNINNLSILAHEIKDLSIKSKRDLKEINWIIQNFRPNNCIDLSLIDIRPFVDSKINNILKKLKLIIPNVKKR